VKPIGTLCLELTEDMTVEGAERQGKGSGTRDIQLRMTFGSTEISVAAIDTATGRCIRAAIDFLNK